MSSALPLWRLQMKLSLGSATSSSTITAVRGTSERAVNLPVSENWSLVWVTFQSEPRLAVGEKKHNSYHHAKSIVTVAEFKIMYTSLYVCMHTYAILYVCTYVADFDVDKRPGHTILKK